VSSNGRFWAAVFHHVTTRSRLARVLNPMNLLFLRFSNFFGAWYTADTESVDTRAQLYFVILVVTRTVKLFPISERDWAALGSHAGLMWPARRVLVIPCLSM
jgi:hypothetical protein